MKELLSPAGNMEALEAAITAGCDAVYLAGKNFGARQFASNFTNEELEYAINLCHSYGIRVYVTANTIIYDSEVDRFISYMEYLHKLNVDAVILEDLGMIDLIHQLYPDLEIHASTQMNAHNIEGVKLLKEMGVKRVVLARETPIELIKEIKENVDIEIEVFIHGALCMSYSGECLMSALIGPRSGNRGTCAQVCRQPYKLEIDDKIKDSGYLLSFKDLNTLDYIDELVKLGIDSFKIEGRMKSKEYVYFVTSLYRRILDGKKTDKNDIKKLMKIFNREFTKGFLFHEENDSIVNKFRPNHMGVRIGKTLDYKNGYLKILLEDDLNINDGIRVLEENDTGGIVTTILKNNKKVRNAYKGDIVEINYKEKIDKNLIVVKTLDYNLVNEINEKLKIKRKKYITGKCEIKKGKNIILTISDGKKILEQVSEYKPEESKTSPLNEIDAKRSLSKLGNTIYEFKDLEIVLDDNVFVPVNILNTLRRDIIDKLDNLDKKEKEIKKGNYKREVPNFKKETKKNILLHTKEEYDKYKNSYDDIIVDDINEFKKINNIDLIYRLPRINEKLGNLNMNLLVGDLGSLYKYEKVDTDFGFNVTNSYTVAYLHSKGVNKVTLSYELTYKQIKLLIEEYTTRYKAHPNLEVITDSYPEVVVTKYNALKKYNVPSGYLIDRFNNKYKLISKDNLMYIYNYKKLIKRENYFEIGINNIRINI